MVEPRGSDPALERALSDLGARIAYPATPELAAGVRARIVARGHRRPSAWWRVPSSPWAIAAVMAVLLLAVGALVAAVPDARHAVADRFGLRGVSFSGATATPTAPGATPTAMPSPRAEDLRFGGDRVSLEAARRMMAFPVALPSLPELRAPDEVYAGAAPPGGHITLVYGARPGLRETSETGVALLLTEFRGEFEPFIRKALSPGVQLEAVNVGGARGYWLEGARHVVVYQDASGEVREDRSRLAGNTLLWERDGITYRLESALDRNQALRIAESVR